MNQIEDTKPKSMSLELLKGQEIISSGGSTISAKALSYFLKNNDWPYFFGKR